MHTREFVEEVFGVRTQTESQPIVMDRDEVRAVLLGIKTQLRIPIDPQPMIAPNQSMKCPIGERGELLRISEEVSVLPVDDDRYSLLFAADLTHTERYGEPELIQDLKSTKGLYLKGVVVPPAFSRSLRLEIIDVRPERLSEISEEDAIAEGIDVLRTTLDIRDEFDRKWRDRYSNISGNPWVWVVEFRRQ